MFKAIKEFFTGKKADVAVEPVAPYKVETPAVAKPVAAEKLIAPAIKPRARKPTPKRAAAIKKPATPKAQ
jgi:hypothetical protein